MELTFEEFAISGPPQSEPPDSDLVAAWKVRQMPTVRKLYSNQFLGPATG
jgi:hypothetical protein